MDLKKNVARGSTGEIISLMYVLHYGEIEKSI